MKVVLLENIRKLGRIGDIVEVKNGFGRNWLLAQKKALRAIPSNLKFFEEQKKQFEDKNVERKEEAEKFALRVKEVTLEMISPAQANGVLYGSITIKDIYDALKAKNVELTKNQINLHKPIKEVGKHEVNISLHPEVACFITLFVGGSKEALHELINPGVNLNEDGSENEYSENESEEQSEDALDDISEEEVEVLELQAEELPA